MAISSVWERRSRGGGSTGATGSHVRRFYVRVDDYTDNESTIYAAAVTAGQLPAMFAPHPTNSGALLRDYRIDHYRGLIWEAILTYTQEPLSSREQDRVTNTTPTSREPIVTLQFSQRDEAIVEDIDGHPFLNSAGEPYTEPVMRPRAVAAINVEAYFTSWQAFMFDYEAKLNSASVTIQGRTFPAKTLLFMPGTLAEPRTENGQTFIPHRFQLLHNRKTWQLKRLDAGFFYLDSGNQIPIEIQGQPPSQPQLLDGSGGLLSSPSPATAVYNTHDVEETADFSTLPGIS